MAPILVLFSSFLLLWPLEGIRAGWLGTKLLNLDIFGYLFIQRFFTHTPSSKKGAPDGIKNVWK
jgi:hypothetical protein